MLKRVQHDNLYKFGMTVCYKKGENHDKETRLHYQNAKKQATQDEIDQKRVEYIALLVKWKMREIIEEELNIKRQSRVDGSRTRKKQQ